MDSETKATGWTPPTQLQVQQEFFRKHGRDAYTEAIDRRWRTMGRLIESGAKIRDGRLG